MIQISFASNYFYDVGMGFPKLSMLAFYWAYFNLEARPAMRKMLWAMTAFVIACYLTILFDDTFFCGTPVSVQWSQEEGACSVFYAPEPFILNFTLNLACYLVVYSIPLILLTQGVLRSSTGVTLTFALGALTIASGIVRFVCLKVGTGQENLVCKYPTLRSCRDVTLDQWLTIYLCRSAQHGRDDTFDYRGFLAWTQDTCREECQSLSSLERS
jgi:hypothetical protein